MAVSLLSGCYGGLLPLPAGTFYHSVRGLPSGLARGAPTANLSDTSCPCKSMCVFIPLSFRPSAWWWVGKRSPARHTSRACSFRLYASTTYCACSVIMGAGKALVLSAGVSLGTYLGLGFPAWIAAGVAVLGFLGFGGLPWTKLAISTLPRDIRYTNK